MSKTIAATAALMGTIIGAGFLALPYVVAQTGFALGMFYLAIIGILMATMMLYNGEIILRTKESHQLTGYAKKYLGNTGKKWMFASLNVGIFLALLAYLIAEGTSISHLIFGTDQYAFQISLAFWFVLSLITYKGIETLKRGEMVSITLVVILIISAVILTSKSINIANYTTVNKFTLPFGVMIFSYLGFSILPEVARILGERRKLLKQTVITGYALVFIIYAIFTTLVVGYKGLDTPRIATFALGKPFILIGIVTMFGAYLALATAMRDIYYKDIKYSKLNSWLLVSITPAILFLILTFLNLANFTEVIGIGGIVAGTVNIIMICLIVAKAKVYGDRKPEYSIPYNAKVIWALIGIIIASALTEIISKFL